MLNEVVVRAGKVKYSKKNNPAVALMERIRASQHLTDPRRKPYYAFDKYDKTVLALNDFNPPRDEGFIAKHMNYLFDFVDTSDISGKPILPVVVKEKSSRVLFRREPHSEKEVVEGLRSNSIMEQLNQEGISKFVADVLREVDIYDNDITVMQNRFVSPLSRIAANYYKFYLDTIVIPSGKILELSFAPHNPESMGFNGRMYLTPGDSSCFIHRVSMQVPKAINLNYVKSLYVVQDFERAPDGTRHKVRDDMSVEIELVPGLQGLYGRRITAYDNFTHATPTADEYRHLDMAASVIVSDEAESRDEQFWQERRLVPLRFNEGTTSTLVARLRRHRWFYWTEKVVNLLVVGYVRTGNPSKIDLGPVNTLVSANTVEGARFRLGGMTTAALSPHFFARAYAAYGTSDRKFKYHGEVEYSFNRKKEHSREFPIHSVMLSHTYDLDQIGQHYLFTNPDNIFLSLKRKENDKVTYRRRTAIDYTLETHSNFSVKLTLKHERQEATEWLPFIDGYGNQLSHYNQASLTLQLRYAPGETFYQMRSGRVPINMDAPVIMLSHEYGPAGWLGSAFCINKTEISAQKRFWFSSFGYTDIILKGAKVWSRVYYPALAWANANLSYTIQPESYALMNPMEFATDQYLSWDLTYWGNGVLFNRIPLVKHLRLREVLTFRGLWGDLSSRNNPELDLSLPRFPFQSFTRPMERTPYMELGVGIDNILTILRVDYVWRLTYRDTPNTDRSGVRVSLHFTF